MKTFRRYGLESLITTTGWPYRGYAYYAADNPKNQNDVEIDAPPAPEGWYIDAAGQWFGWVNGELTGPDYSNPGHRWDSTLIDGQPVGWVRDPSLDPMPAQISSLAGKRVLNGRGLYATVLVIMTTMRDSGDPDGMDAWLVWSDATVWDRDSIFIFAMQSHPDLALTDDDVDDMFREAKRLQNM